ncbi:formylglycine-generating enzyme family protein [bacterium]|nr:formylglycine-generating enzyme family protein [bacterium]
MTTKKIITAIFALALVIASASWGDIVSNISCTQRWPWNGKVDIDYTLTSGANSGMPLFKLGFYGQIGSGSPFPLQSLSGDGASRVAVGEGTRRVTWDAYQDLGATVDASDVQVVIVARESAMPAKYLVLDLNTYRISERFDDPLSSDTSPKRTEIWFRRVEPGTFTMGSSAEDQAYFNSNYNNEDVHSVTITKPFYIAIYTTTEAQFAKIDSETTITSMKPKTGLDYTDLRGSNVGTNWPGLGYRVDSGSFFDKLRTKVVGEFTFDLPTDAQWEMAARSKGDGTFIGDLTWNNGSPYAKTDATTDTNLNVVAWYKTNIRDVGLKAPNCIGLYDMHGNVWEWCLDWTQDHLGNSPVTDPVGPLHQISTQGQRLRRGGASENNPIDCRIGRRNPAMVGSQHTNYGFRMVIVEP